MSLRHKTFVKTTNDPKALPQAFAEIDEAFNQFAADQHWSQGRDAFQSITSIGDQIVIARTYVYTDEQLATAMPGAARTARPPV